MSMSSELRAFIREVAAEQPEATPGEIASTVATLTKGSDLRRFLEEALYPLVCDLLRGGRRNAMDNALGGNPGGGGRSYKLEERREHFAQLMSERVRGSDGWKLVGDCTIEDLRFCIQRRHELIARTHNQINNFEQLIALMKKHKATFARELVAQEAAA